MSPLALLRSLLLPALVVLAGAAVPRVARAVDFASRGPQTAAQVRADKLPLSFELNRGQVDAQVRFLARGPGYSLFLTPTSAVVTTANHAELRLGFAGANPGARVTGAGRLPGTVNYFLGNNPSRWQTDIPTYARVIYRRIYPGIDLAFHDAPSAGVEYDWILHPGADPARIHLAIGGAALPHFDGEGDLVLSADGARLLQRLPVAYQTAGGMRRVVPAHYVLLPLVHGSRAMAGTPEIGIAVGRYDRARPLVIDPTLAYSTYLGGTDEDGAAGIAVDGKGDAYITGDTLSLDFPVTAHPAQRELRSDPSCKGDLANPGGNCVDAFVAKLAPDGRTLLYSTYLGGTLDDYGYAVDVDAQGDAYVTGGTLSGNFPTIDALQPHSNGGADLGDAFVTELGPDGDRLLFSTYLGGKGDQDGQGIAVSGSDIYVSGRTNSPSFPLSHPLQSHLGSARCAYAFHAIGSVRCYAAFVSKLSADGRTLEYSTYFGGNSTVFSWGIAVVQGRAVIAGQTTASNLLVVRPLQRRYAGGKCGIPGQYEPCDDGFVSELTANGQGLVFSTYLGAPKEDIAHAVAVDRAGDVYVAGETQSRHFRTLNAIEPRFRGDATMGFVTKLNPSGTKLLYSTYLGGSGAGGDIAYAVAADSAGNAYVAGSTTSTDFPKAHAFDAHLAPGGNTQNGFVTKIDPTGRRLLYSSYLGGSDHDLVGSVALDDSGNAYVAGFATSTDFPTTHAFQRHLAGGTFDVIVAKIAG